MELCALFYQNRTIFYHPTKSLTLNRDAFARTGGDTVVDRLGSTGSDSFLDQHIFVEGLGALHRLIGFDMTVDKDHIIGTIVLHPEVSAAGGILFGRTEMRMVSHGAFV